MHMATISPSAGWHIRDATYWQGKAQYAYDRSAMHIKSAAYINKPEDWMVYHTARAVAWQAESAKCYHRARVALDLVLKEGA